MLDVRRIIAIDVQHYDTNRSRFEAGPQFVNEHTPLHALGERIDRLLIVDDIIDTGETIKLVSDATRDYAKEVKIATLYVRSNQKHSADWHWKVEDEWVVFPWAPEG